MFTKNIFFNVANYFLFHMECYHAIRKYGPTRMAWNLQEKGAMSLYNYVELFHLNANDNQKALILVNFLTHRNRTRTQFQKIIRSLWHLSHLLTQIG